MATIERHINSLATAPIVLHGLQGQDVFLRITALRVDDLYPLSLLCKGTNITGVQAPFGYLNVCPTADDLIFDLFDTCLVSFERSTQHVWSGETCRMLGRAALRSVPLIPQRPS